MRFFIGSCLIFLIAFNCSAQQLKTVEPGHPFFAKIKELKNRKLDTIVAYYCSCGPNYITISPPDTCKAQDARYLIWNENNSYFIQKFDWCNSYKPKVLISPILNIVKSNYSTIEKEKFKLFKYTEKGNTETYNEILIPSHSNHYVFQVYTTNTVLYKEIHESPLNKEYDGYTNENYEYNNNLLITKLKKLIEDQINNYNK